MLRDLRLINFGGDDVSLRADHVAAAIALIKASLSYQLSSVLTFHNTIAASEAFAVAFRHVYWGMIRRGLVVDGRRARITHIDGRSSVEDRLVAVDTLKEHDDGVCVGFHFE